MPIQINPAEFILDLVSSDFAVDRDVADTRLEEIHSAWSNSTEALAVESEIRLLTGSGEKGKTSDDQLVAESFSRPNSLHIVLSLLHRSWIKSRRDVVAYGIRLIMYLGQFYTHSVSFITGSANMQKNRIGNYDWNSLVALRYLAGKYSTVYQCNCKKYPIRYGRGRGRESSGITY